MVRVKGTSNKNGHHVLEALGENLRSDFKWSTNNSLCRLNKIIEKYSQPEHTQSADIVDLQTLTIIEDNGYVARLKKRKVDYWFCMKTSSSNEDDYITESEATDEETLDPLTSIPWKANTGWKVPVLDVVMDVLDTAFERERQRKPKLVTMPTKQHSGLSTQHNMIGFGENSQHQLKKRRLCADQILSCPLTPKKNIKIIGCEFKLSDPLLSIPATPKQRTAFPDNCLRLAKKSLFSNIVSSDDNNDPLAWMKKFHVKDSQSSLCSAQRDASYPVRKTIDWSLSKSSINGDVSWMKKFTMIESSSEDKQLVSCFAKSTADQTPKLASVNGDVNWIKKLAGINSSPEYVRMIESSSEDKQLVSCFAKSTADQTPKLASVNGDVNWIKKLAGINSSPEESTELPTVDISPIRSTEDHTKRKSETVPMKMMELMLNNPVPDADVSYSSADSNQDISKEDSLSAVLTESDTAVPNSSSSSEYNTSSDSGDSLELTSDSNSSSVGHRQSLFCRSQQQSTAQNRSRSMDVKQRHREVHPGFRSLSRNNRYIMSNGFGQSDSPNYSPSRYMQRLALSSPKRSPSRKVHRKVFF